MDVFVDPDSEIGLAEQIYEQIRSSILAGLLESGDRLPPSRELAPTLGISRHTVTTAYSRLTAEGYLDGLGGAGTVVSDLFHHLDFVRTPAEVTEPESSRHQAAARYDLRPGAPDPTLFPASDWKRYTRWAVDEHDATYQDPAGHADLRLALAKWIGRSRGVQASIEQLVVTAGAQQALYLLARVSTQPGDIVAMEDPGYHRFRLAAESAGAKVVPVPVDGEGIIVEAIPEKAKVAYVTPSHQFPTGVTMSMRRRLELLDRARQHGMLVIEDDYDSEYRYVDRPLEPLFRLDHHDNVAYVAGFSKILSPAVRIGFTVAPRRTLGPLIDLRRLIDWAPSSVDQLTLRGFITNGRLDQHLRRVRPIYQGRHEIVSTFLAGLARDGLVEETASHAGLHVSVRVNSGIETDMVEQLAAQGVAIDGMASYAMRRLKTAGLVLGFGSAPSDHLVAALPIVETVVRSTA